MGEKVNFKLSIESEKANNATIRITIFNKEDLRVMAFDSADLGSIFEFEAQSKRIINCTPISSLFLKPGRYRINISMRKGAILLDHIIAVKEFEVLGNDIFGFGRFSLSDMPLIVMKHQWT